MQKNKQINSYKKKLKKKLQQKTTWNKVRLFYFPKFIYLFQQLNVRFPITTKFIDFHSS